MPRLTRETVEQLPQDPDILTISGAAEILGLSRQRVHALLGRFTTARVIPGSTTLIMDRAEVEKFKEERDQAAAKKNQENTEE